MSPRVTWTTPEARSDGVTALHLSAEAGHVGHLSDLKVESNHRYRFETAAGCLFEDVEGEENPAALFRNEKYNFQRIFVEGRFYIWWILMDLKTQKEVNMNVMNV